MKKAELVFVAAPWFSHLVASIEFAKRLIDRDPRISITILIMKMLIAPANSDANAKSLVHSEPRIKLIDLPQPECAFIDPCAYMENHKPYVKDLVTNLLSSMSNSNSIQLAGLVIDFMCNSMIDVANELGLPSYLLVPCNASFLGLMLHLKTTHMQNRTEIKYSDSELIVPSFFNPIPPRVLPTSFFSKEGYTIFKRLAQRLGDTKGFIVNTFVELESYAISSFLDGETPPVYPVGPVHELKSRAHSSPNSAQHNHIMNWLDDQPTSSVVFLCFGSAGGFGAPQMKEIAIGLENSGHKFLWSIRKSLAEDKDNTSMARDYQNLEDNLPNEFLERTKGRGMICGWAPQVEVLDHKAIGGFVSHCGWNSILESLWYGVPIVTWPIFAEQQLNAFLLVKELELAVEMKLDYRSGGDLVMANEIEKAIRCVMEGDNIVRKRVKEMGEKARKAFTDGGSSVNYLGRLIEDMIGK